MPLSPDDSLDSSIESAKTSAMSEWTLRDEISASENREVSDSASGNLLGRILEQPRVLMGHLSQIQRVRIQDVRESRFSRKSQSSAWKSGAAKSCLVLAGFGAYVFGPQFLAQSLDVEQVYQAVIPSVRQTERVFTEGIVLKLDREAPPVVALEEALREDPWTEIEAPAGFEVPATPLSVGSPTLLAGGPAARHLGGGRLTREQVGVQIARDIQKDNDRLDSHRQTLESRGLQARGIATETAASVTPPRIAAAVPAERESGKVFETQASTAPSIVISASQVGLSRDQILAAFLGPIVQAEKTPPEARPATPSRPQVARVDSPRAVPNSTDPRVTAILENARSSRRPTQDMAATSAQPERSASDRSLAMAPVHRQVMVSGSLEFAEGLALTHPSDSLVVLREDRGRLQEAGVVWVKEARYEIFLESLQGSLVAELRTPQGTVVGRGRVSLASIVSRLEELNRDRPENKRVDGVSLRLAPTTPGLFGQVRSAYSVGAHQQQLKSVRVLAQGTQIGTRAQTNGQFRDVRFADGSRPLIEARAQEHLTTYAFASAGQNTQMTLLPQKMALTIRELVAETITPQDTTPQAMAEMGMIWGRVLRSGEGVADARVEPMSSGVSAVVYFNDLLIPDPALDRTSKNGWFVIPYARQGGHILHVNLGTRWSDPLVVGVSPGAVAQVEAEITRGSEVHVRGLDAFRPDWPLHVDVRPMLHRRGRRVTIDRTQDSTLRVAHADQAIALDLDAGPEYIRTRMILDPERRDLNLPMLPRGWLERVRSQVKHNSSPSEGVVVGFFQGQRFQLQVSESWKTDSTRVVYFDERGEPTSAPYGEAGGGFVVFGVREGLHNMVIGLEGSDRVFATSAWVDSSTPSVINHWLR